MTVASELLTAANTTLSAALQEGVNALSRAQTVVFTRYLRLVLPLDGFVFWVKADLVATSTYNSSTFNARPFDASGTVESAAPTMAVQGSLHYAVEQRQEEVETFGLNTILFTTPTEIKEFNGQSPNAMWIARLSDGTRYTFSKRGMFYPAAGIYHYMGEALHPSASSQIVDDVTSFDSKSLVVSNSLPLWLALNYYSPPYPNFNNSIPLFPSYAVPANLSTPYGVIHIPPDQPDSIQVIPYLDRKLGHHQLVSDRVTITFYGCRNSAVCDFIDCVERYTYDWDYFGIMEAFPVRDDKKTQPEMTVLSMRKTVEFMISYYQSRVNDVVRQLITTCIPTFIPSENPAFT